MRRCITLTATVPLLAVTMLIAGCGLLSQPKTPPMNSYRIAPQVAPPPAPAATCNLVLDVHSVAVSTPWATNNMQYTRTAHSLASYAYHEWAGDPATMLTGALVEALDGSGLYRGVLGPLNPGNADLILAVTLVKGPLQVFSASAPGETQGKSGAAPASSQETLSLAASLTEAQSGNLIAGKAFSAEQSAAPNAYGGVVAANVIARELIGRMLGWLQQTNQGIKGCAAE